MGAAIAPFLPEIVGGGLGLLSGLFNQPQQQIQTPSDPGYYNYLNQVRQAGLNGQNSPDFQSAAQMLQLGTGQNPGGLQQLLQMFQQNMGPYLALQRQNAVNSANAQATQEGAYGGSGSQVGAVTAGNLADQSAGVLAQNSLQQYMQNALQAAGQYAQMPGQQMNLLTPGLQTQGQTTTTPSQFNPIQALLGGALGGYGFSLLGNQPGGGTPTNIPTSAGVPPVNFPTFGAQYNLGTGFNSAPASGPASGPAVGGMINQ